MVVLTGGASRRLGRDKATSHVGGRRLVDRILAEVPADVPVVIVGPLLDAMARPVRFVREDPPGSGPLAAIGAGLAEVSTPFVGLIAADMPFAVPVVAEALSRLASRAPARLRPHARSWIRSTQWTESMTQAGCSGADAVVPVDARWVRAAALRGLPDRRPCAVRWLGSGCWPTDRCGRSCPGCA